MGKVGSFLEVAKHELMSWRAEAEREQREVECRRVQQREKWRWNDDGWNDCRSKGWRCCRVSSHFHCQPRECACDNHLSVKRKLRKNKMRVHGRRKREIAAVAVAAADKVKVEAEIVENRWRD